MPIYEFLCESCGRVEERLQKLTDPPPEACAECGGKMAKIMSRNSFQLKGGGWYKDLILERGIERAGQGREQLDEQRRNVGGRVFIGGFLERIERGETPSREQRGRRFQELERAGIRSFPGFSAQLERSFQEQHDPGGIEPKQCVRPRGKEREVGRKELARIFYR